MKILGMVPGLRCTRLASGSNRSGISIIILSSITKCLVSGTMKTKQKNTYEKKKTQEMIEEFVPFNLLDNIHSHSSQLTAFPS